MEGGPWEQLEPEVTHSHASLKRSGWSVGCVCDKDNTLTRPLRQELDEQTVPSLIVACKETFGYAIGLLSISAGLE